LSLGAAVASAAVLLFSGLSVSGASSPHQLSLAGQESALGPWADRGPVDVPDGKWYDATTGTVRDDALEVDAALLAKSAAISHDEAVARLGAQQRMDSVLEEAQSLYPELVGIRWVDGHVVAQFKGEAPKGALELLATAGAKIDYELVRYSANELERLQADLGEVLEGMGVTDYAVGIAPIGQRIIASVSTATKSSSSDGAPISKQSISAALPARLADANVDIQVVDVPVTQPTTTYGGTDGRINTSFICTNGFTVIGPATGVAADGHCHSLNSYYDWVTGIFHTMVLADSHEGAWGDFAWYTTNGTEVDDFYADELGNRRDVTGTRATVSMGDEYIWFGRRTNNNWLSWVEFPLQNTSGPQRLACLHDHSAMTGDSGGPVYLGQVAAGFVYGYIWLDGAYRDCFSRAAYIDNAMGVFIQH
jgi:hypothetical protein